MLSFFKAVSQLSRWRLGTNISTNLVEILRSLPREMNKPFCPLKLHVTIRVTQLAEHIFIQLLLHSLPFTTKPSCCVSSSTNLDVLWRAQTQNTPVSFLVRNLLKLSASQPMSFHLKWLIATRHKRINKKQQQQHGLATCDGSAPHSAKLEHEYAHLQLLRGNLNAP